MQQMGEESRLLPPRAGHEPERRQAARQPEPDLPSWPTVLRTTIRLSAQRRRQAMARHKWRTVAFVTAVALIVVAAVIAIAHASGGREALSQRPARSATPRSSGRQQEHRSPAYAGPAFTAARQAAAAWIAGQVAAGVTVACDPQMCQALAPPCSSPLPRRARNSGRPWQAATPRSRWRASGPDGPASRFVSWQPTARPPIWPRSAPTCARDAPPDGGCCAADGWS